MLFSHLVLKLDEHDEYANNGKVGYAIQFYFSIFITRLITKNSIAAKSLTLFDQIAKTVPF